MFLRFVFGGLNEKMTSEILDENTQVSPKSSLISYK